MTDIAPDLDSGLELLAGGTAAYGRMLSLIDAARESVDIETYIFTADAVGARFRAALVAAAARGVRVRVLVDAYGSEALPADWFEPLRAAGGEWRWFNPRRLLRLSFRNHRKSLRCDGSAVIGGLNIADEYDGDGIARGWRDFAVALDHPPLLAALAASFERMWALAPFGRAEVRAFWRGRPPRLPRSAPAAESGGPALLTSGAGCRGALLRRRLRLDLLAGRHSLAWVAYFLPSRRLGRAIRAAARRSRVEILLGARTDVPLARWASERQFAALLRAGVRLHEYQPQVVHAKIVVADDIVYVGSANLDVRSLQINYELLLRLSAPRLAARLRAEFAADVARSAPLELHTWQAGRRWWHGLRSWLACQLLGRLDPFIARRKLRSLG